MVGVASHDQAWWDSPFAHAFVPDEWHHALQDHFIQRKNRLLLEQKRLMEQNSVEELVFTKGGTGHTLFDKKQTKGSKQKAKPKKERLTSDERLLVAGQSVDGLIVEEDGESPKKKGRKRKRAGTVTKTLNEEEMFQASYHSETHLKTTREEFDQDSEDDVDMEWVHSINDKLLADLVDVTDGEHCFMSIWNRYMHEHQEIFHDEP